MNKAVCWSKQLQMSPVTPSFDCHSVAATKYEQQRLVNWSNHYENIHKNIYKVGMICYNVTSFKTAVTAQIIRGNLTSIHIQTLRLCTIH